MLPQPLQTDQPPTKTLIQTPSPQHAQNTTLTPASTHHLQIDIHQSTQDTYIPDNCHTNTKQIHIAHFKITSPGIKTHQQKKHKPTKRQLTPSSQSDNNPKRTNNSTSNTTTNSQHSTEHTKITSNTTKQRHQPKEHLHHYHRGRNHMLGGLILTALPQNPILSPYNKSSTTPQTPPRHTSPPTSQLPPRQRHPPPSTQLLLRASSIYMTQKPTPIITTHTVYINTTKYKKNQRIHKYVMILPSITSCHRRIAYTFYLFLYGGSWLKRS